MMIRRGRVRGAIETDGRGSTGRRGQRTRSPIASRQEHAATGRTTSGTRCCKTNASVAFVGRRSRRSPRAHGAVRRAPAVPRMGICAPHAGRRRVCVGPGEWRRPNDGPRSATTLGVAARSGCDSRFQSPTRSREARPTRVRNTRSGSGQPARAGSRCRRHGLWSSCIRDRDEA